MEIESILYTALFFFVITFIFACLLICFYYVFCLFYWDYLQCTYLLVLVVYVLLSTIASLHLYIVCAVIIVFFCELFCLLYYDCPLCAFLPAALVVFMLLFAIAGAQWRIASADWATACLAAGVAEASKVRWRSTSLVATEN